MKIDRLTITHLTLLSALIFLLYSNSFNTAWHLDDGPNILHNHPILIKTISPESLWKSLFAKPFAEGTLYRPVANLTFALNYFIGNENPTGYHVTNLFIHICTAIFLYQSIILILNSTQVPLSTKTNRYRIAVISSLLWAINPIQTQAITYIVQRMASMAGMFFIGSIFLYLKARQANSLTNRIAYLCSCLLCFLLALGCKENAITLIPTLLAVEYFLLSPPNKKFSKIFLWITLLATICILAAGIYYIADQHYLNYLSKPIGSRPFSIGERLLTQPSILLYYLSLIFYPSPERLSIDHSFTLSTSLWQPWTTLPAILIIISLIIVALSQRKKRPLLGFAILFFFINHLVESTIIPLEMIFEHRNYIPSMFLFLPLTAGFCSAIETSKQAHRLLHPVLYVSLPVVLITYGLGTYNRNTTWMSEESLWADTLKKAPASARPYAKLGEIYGWQKEKNQKNLQTATALLEKAIQLESPRKSFKAAIVGNIGKIYANYGLLDLAVSNYQRSIEINPNFIISQFDLANALTLQGKFKEALHQINQVIAKNDLQSRFFNLKTIILLRLDRPNQAAISCSQAIKKTTVNKRRYFYNCGVSLSRAGHLEQGRWFLGQSLKLIPGDRRILYSLIENRLIAHDTTAAKKYADQLINLHSIPKIKTDLEKLPKDYSSVPVNVELITPLIHKTAYEMLTHQG